MAYSVSDAVIEVMQQMQPLKYAFDLDLVNYSALARRIQPIVSQKLGEEVSLDAIIMAIRRNATNFWPKRQKQEVFSVFSQTKLELRTGLVLIHLKRTPENYEKLAHLEKKLNWGEGGKMYVIQRSEELSIVALASIEKELIEGVGRDCVLFTRENLALITLTLPSQNTEVAGVLETISHSFSLLGVSILLYFTSFQKSSFLFDETKASAVYEKFSRLISESKVFTSASKS
ncbi:hypothetical protein HUU53_03185 [Candidatus Micrarchaeota archaeon]|nr:hypothetical protein [Candidatus Micrarchaeota archaeon]